MILGAYEVDQSGSVANWSTQDAKRGGQGHRKYKGPDGLGLDIRVRGWDEQIKARMQLYQLTPSS